MMLSTSTETKKARLLAQLILADRTNLLLLPDFKPPMLELLGFDSSFLGSINLPRLPLLDSAPLMCDYCQKEVGVVSKALAASLPRAVHDGCKMKDFGCPPWDITGGMAAIAARAFNYSNFSVALLKHFIITEFIANENSQPSSFSDGFTSIATLSQ